MAWAAEHFPERTALRSRERSVSYAQLPLLAAATAALINMADPSALPVALLLPDSAEWLIAHLALRQLNRATVCIAGDISGADLLQRLRCIGASSAGAPGGHIDLDCNDHKRLEGAAIIFSKAVGKRARAVEICRARLDTPVRHGCGYADAFSGDRHFYRHLPRGDECRLADWLFKETVDCWVSALSDAAPNSRNN